MTAARILLIEDEPGLVLTLTDRLQVHGYEVVSARDGEVGFTLAREGGFDLILLDVMLPKRNGFEVCRMLREQGVTTPILMLTARTQVADKVHGLRIGSDDYLTKPFETLELLARIEALLRRSQLPAAQTAEAMQFGPAEVDFRRSEARFKGQPVNLTAREFQLLRYLAEHRGEVISRETLLREVWGLNFVSFTRTVDVHMTWLRQKLEENPKAPRYLLTVRGIGYKLGD